MPRSLTASAATYQLRIALRHIEPPIWRRVLVPGDTTLARLHRILQRVMGWEDAHLHQFTIDGIRYAPPDPEAGEDERDERRVRLAAVLPLAQARFQYLYDFGDDWLHDVTVEAIRPAERGKMLPHCLEGARACPPEDCGGVSGYAEFLEAIMDPTHPEHVSSLTWVGGRFDHEAFDPEVVNRALRRVR